MTAVDFINFALALTTIGLGLCGWLATRWTMSALDMQAGPSNMAFTEVSGVSGCLFVGMGLAVMVINDPVAWVILGAAYGGAALGRVTSILRDDASFRKSWTFFGTELAFAAWLVFANLPGAQA
ncbi:DUF4345 family protein [Gymnodinialimonas sp.]